MSGNRYIADLAVTYVLKNAGSQSGAWVHIEGKLLSKHCGSIFCAPSLFMDV